MCRKSGHLSDRCPKLRVLCPNPRPGCRALYRVMSAAHVAAAGSGENLYPARQYDPHDFPSTAETHVGGGNVKWVSDLFSGATLTRKPRLSEPLRDDDPRLPPLPQSGPADAALFWAMREARLSDDNDPFMAMRETRSRSAPESAFIALLGTGLPSCARQSSARDSEGRPIPLVSTSEVHDVSTEARTRADPSLEHSRWARVAHESREVTLAFVAAENIFAVRHVVSEISRTGHPQSRGSRILTPLEQFYETFNWNSVPSRGEHFVHAGFRRRRSPSRHGSDSGHETDTDSEPHRGPDENRALFDVSHAPEVWLNAERRDTCFSGLSLPHAYWFPQ